MLKLLLGGRSRKQIAGLLGCAPETVKRHLSAIYAKLEVGSAHEVMALALRTPWLARLVSPTEVTSAYPKESTR